MSHVETVAEEKIAGCSPRAFFYTVLEPASVRTSHLPVKKVSSLKRVIRGMSPKSSLVVNRVFGRDTIKLREVSKASLPPQPAARRGVAPGVTTRGR